MLPRLVNHPVFWKERKEEKNATTCLFPEASLHYNQITATFPPSGSDLRRPHARPSSHAGSHTSMLALLLSSAASVAVASVAAASVTAASATAVPQLFAWQRAVAGMAAYCSATLVSSPIDVLKTRMQLRKADSPTGMLPLAITMLRKEGALVFFSGIGPALCMAPAAVVQYTLMDPLRAMMPLILAAAIAGALDITMKCPLDMLKTRLQSTTSKISPSAMLLDIWRTDGVRGLWTGYGATLVSLALSLAGLLQPA